MALAEFQKPSCAVFLISSARCGEPVHWYAKWSDREMYCCDDHRDEVRGYYDGDHEYDKTGLIWEDARGQVTYEDR